MSRICGLALLVLLPSVALADGEANVSAYDYYAPETSGAVVVAADPPWTARVGLGVRASGVVLGDGGSGMGAGGELLVRLSRHFSTEIAAEYDRSTPAAGDTQRRDVPLTVGLRLHLAGPESRVSPYLVVAGGLDFAELDSATGHQSSTLLDGEVGGGLEVRLGQRIALVADTRVNGRTSLTNAPAFSDGVGFSLRLGAAFYY